MRSLLWSILVLMLGALALPTLASARERRFQVHPTGQQQGRLTRPETRRANFNRAKAWNRQAERRDEHRALQLHLAIQGVRQHSSPSMPRIVFGPRTRRAARLYGHFLVGYAAGVAIGTAAKGVAQAVSGQ